MPLYEFTFTKIDHNEMPPELTLDVDVKYAYPQEGYRIFRVSYSFDVSGKMVLDYFNEHINDIKKRSPKTFSDVSIADDENAIVLEKTIRALENADIDSPVTITIHCAYDTDSNPKTV